MFNAILLDFTSEETQRQYKSCAEFYSKVPICLLFLPQALLKVSNLDQIKCLYNDKHLASRSILYDFCHCNM